MPRDPDRDGHARPLDLAGMVLLGIGALAPMLGISYLGEAGASAASPLFVVPVIAGLLGLALFGRHIRRVHDPFIAPRLIAGPGFGAGNVINIACDVRVRDRSRHGSLLAGQPERRPAARAGPVRGHRGAAVNGPDVRQIAAVSITTAIIAQSAAPGQLQAKVFIVFAALLLACLPVIARVHEHRGPW